MRIRAEGLLAAFLAGLGSFGETTLELRVAAGTLGELLEKQRVYWSQWSGVDR